MAIDIEKAFKLPKEHRYFNISVLWIYYYTGIVRLLYRLNIRHEAVTLMSLMFGIAAGLFLLRPGYHSLLLSALFVHLKDIFDASDGSLARMKGQTNRIARFLDSLCDFAAEDIDEAMIADHLYTSGMPDPDLLVRTAGEMRISNFLLWQISYAELWVTDVCWPEFDEQRLHEAIRSFQARDRRYGGLPAKGDATCYDFD